MKFILMILDNPKAHAKLSEADFIRILKEHEAFGTELASRNKLVDGQRLRPEESARIRFENGERIIVDGPFAEAKEVVGGYYVIECASRQEALEWARKCPIFETDAVEVRAVWEA
jgi:hypothetical protein